MSLPFFPQTKQFCNVGDWIVIASAFFFLLNQIYSNPPVFERPTYRTQITEEDDRNLPKRVLQVNEYWISHVFLRSIKICGLNWAFFVPFPFNFIFAISLIDISSIPFSVAIHFYSCCFFFSFYLCWFISFPICS